MILHTWYFSHAPHAVQVSKYLNWCFLVYKSGILCFLVSIGLDLVSAENGAGINKMINITYLILPKRSFLLGNKSAMKRKYVSKAGYETGLWNVSLLCKQCLQCLLNIDLVKLEVNIFQAIIARVWECLPLVHLPLDPSPKVKLKTSVKPLYILRNIFPSHPEPENSENNTPQT